MPTSASAAVTAGTTIIDRLKHLVAALDIMMSAEQIDETTLLFEGGLGLDSFAVLELIVGIEREFGIEFPEADLAPDSFKDLRSLGGVLARILRHGTDHAKPA
jgi:acyl carrier protein